MNKTPLVTPTVLHPVPVHSPWYHVGIDFVGPIHPTTTNGNRYILTVSDYLTKWVEAIPLPSKCAPGVSKALFKVLILLFIQLSLMFFFADIHENGSSEIVNVRSRKRI